ncbi:hypothetical protein NBRC116492_24780 [Aurantivibrio infirmus]
MKTIGTIIIAAFLIFVFNAYEYFVGLKNIENCMKLEEKATVEQVLDIMGEPNDTYDNGLLLHYYSARPSSSCNIFLKFETTKEKAVILKTKFCDDGEVYKCQN